MNLKANKSQMNFILSKDWTKLWSFGFSIWFLDIVIETHIKHNNTLGYENENTLHIIENNQATAFFLEEEIRELEKIRNKKILSKRYMNKHYKEGKETMEEMKCFLNNLDVKSKKYPESIKLFLKYSNLLEKCLSYYRASRPELFEIVEKELNKTSINKEKREYLKKLVIRYGKFRLDLKRVWLRAERESTKFKKVIAKELNINLKELGRFTTEEIINLKGRKDISNIAKERKSCVFGLINGEKILITGAKSKKVIKNLTPTIKQTKILLGKIAYPGIVKGRVRLIPQIDYKEMIKKAKEFKKGEILVMGMTQPDIMPICKRARAIITDEGGITSHAAIISREMNKPCIIGTKIATKVLKDGDLVEVDANKGIVKILKNTK